MGLTKRSGEYGYYWGNDLQTSNALPMDKMELNAEYILQGLGNKGYTKNAICGMLGNMQSESTINPGRWEGDRVEWSGHGYGLVQWTPYTKYFNWCGSDDPSSMDNNLERIIWEVDNGEQWISTNGYPLTFYEFVTSTESPEYLAMAFLNNYERPADPNQPIRATQARAWWDYFEHIEPQPVPPVRVQNTRKWLYASAYRINIIKRG